MVAAKGDTVLPAALLGESSGVLLFVCAAEETAKRIESGLRNAGHPLRAAWVTDLEDLEDVLRRNPPDLILSEADLAAAPRDSVIGLCRKLRPDLPVVLLGRQYTASHVVAALDAGARDWVVHNSPGDLRHLELVVIRELMQHHHLRDLRRTQQRLADFESRHQQLTAGTGDAIARISEGIIAGANPAFAHLLGHDDATEIADQPLIDLVVEDQRSRVKERLRQVLKGKHNGEPLELAFLGKRGKVPVSAQLLLGNENGESVIELLIRSEGGKGTPASAHIAFHDRAVFADAIAVATGDRNKASGALLLRIDGFPQLEHRVGHADAQQVTARVAEAVHQRLSGEDQSFAFSVDELGLLLYRPSFSEIEQFADFLLREIGGQAFSGRHHEAQVTLTVAVFPLGGSDTPDAVLRQIADEARKVSAKGGSRVVVLGATAQAHIAEREEEKKAAQVKKALEENRLKLAYQSIASLEGESRDHFDVLLRMIDDDGREWHASEFLSAAVKFNLMRVIDRWVVTRALAVIGKRVSAKESSVLFVKISEDTLKDAEGFLAWLKQLCKTQSLKSDEIVFQLREMHVQNHVGKAKLLMNGLRDLGAGLALEHYGTGTNSMQLLDHLPLSFVKFHPSFTQQFGEKDTQKHLADLVEAAKHHKLKTIVSHVEDAHVMARLWQMGVNFIQGYHVQEPEVVLLSSDLGARP